MSDDGKGGIEIVNNGSGLIPDENTPSPFKATGDEKQEGVPIGVIGSTEQLRKESEVRDLEVTISKRNNTEVTVIEDSADDPAGATHEYMVYAPKNENENSKRVLGVISFQRGPIREFGVNGVQNEDLIAICIDRLQHFQKGPYACRENAIALTKLEEASMWLEKRTNDRKARGVEGTSIK
jgi:hypothetical protein